MNEGSSESELQLLNLCNSKCSVFLERIATFCHVATTNISGYFMINQPRVAEQL